MAAKKGQAEKKPPECPLYLRVLIDTFVKGLQDYPLRGRYTPANRAGLDGLRGMVERVRAETRGGVAGMLNHPTVTEAIKRRLAWECGKVEGEDGYTPEMLERVKERIWGAFRRMFVEGGMGSAKRICKRFGVQVADERTEGILAAAWDHRGLEFYFDTKSITQKMIERHIW